MRYSFLLLAPLLLLPLASHASFFDDDAAQPCASANGASFELQQAGQGHMSESVVKEILSAKKTIRVAARAFVSKPVSEALIKAERAGVDVKIVLNRKTNLGIDSAGQFLAIMSQPPHLTRQEDVLYADFMLIDGRDVLTGSIATFSDATEETKHAASVLIVRNAPDLAARYLTQWMPLWSDADVMKAPK